MTTTVHSPRHAATNTTTVPLRLEDVSLTYPDGDGRTLKALDQVNLELQHGTMTALVGPSGSGKSSLLAVAAGLITPTSGRVLVQGNDLVTMGAKQRTALRGDQIAIIFQQPNLIASLTALENLQLAAHIKGIKPSDSRDRALRLLDRVGLAKAADRRPHQLSGGMRQRVNIARALMGEPSLLLVDEPTSALDHERSAEVVQLLAEVTHEFDAATVLVTHDVEFTSDADRTVHLRDGRLVN